MPRRDIVVVGASAGGIEACRTLVASLPADFPGSVFVVVHIPGGGVSLLPEIFSRDSALPALHPRDGMAIKPGHIYVAPPDHHLLLKRGYIRLINGPEENHSRPAVDPLFRTAAAAYGSRVIGVILSGNLDDGTAGLESIKSRGGTTVAQDLEDAICQGMPASAIENVGVDYILPVAQIGGLLEELVEVEVAVMTNPADEEEKDVQEMNVNELQGAIESGELTGLTCPACGGILREKVSGDTADYRCRVGHAFTVEHLDSEMSTAAEAALWNAIRVLEEKEQLNKKIARRMAEQQSTALASHFEERGSTASRDAELIRQLLIARETREN